MKLTSETFFVLFLFYLYVFFVVFFYFSLCCLSLNIFLRNLFISAWVFGLKYIFSSYLAFLNGQLSKGLRHSL